MNTAAELLRALQIAKVGEKPPPGWHTCVELANEAGLSRDRMAQIIVAAVRAGKVVRQNFKLPGARNPVPHYKATAKGAVGF